MNITDPALKLSTLTSCQYYPDKWKAQRFFNTKWNKDKQRIVHLITKPQFILVFICSLCVQKLRCEILIRQASYANLNSNEGINFKWLSHTRCVAVKCVILNNFQCFFLRTTACWLWLHVIRMWGRTHSQCFQILGRSWYLQLKRIQIYCKIRRVKELWNWNQTFFM